MIKRRIGPPPARGRPRSAKRGAGFTLIEVVVAFVMLSLVLASSYQIFTTGLRRASGLEDQSIALAMAQSHLAESSIGETFKPGTSAGESEDRRFRWNVTVADFDDGGDPSKRGLQTYYPVRIAVHVAWTSGAAQERFLDLSTLVLAKTGTP